MEEVYVDVCYSIKYSLRPSSVKVQSQQLLNCPTKHVTVAKNMF